MKFSGKRNVFSSGRIRTRLAIGGILLLLILPLKAETDPAGLTTFSSSTELVLIPTIVHDKSGAHIPGLVKGDFSLKDDGKSHPIAVFEEVKTSSARVSRSAGEHGTFSNFEAAGGDYHRLNIILLDFANTPFADQVNVKNELLKFLSEVAGSGEPMCLLVLTRNGLTVLHDFTEDPKRLADGLRKPAPNTVAPIDDSTIDREHPKPGDPLSALLTSMISGQLQAQAQVSSMESKQLASTTVGALLQIANAFRGLPGRKALIWASSGFPFSLTPPEALTCDPGCPVRDRDEMHPQFDNLWKQMNDAQIAMYTVDLRSAASTMPAAVERSFTHAGDVGDPQFDTAALAQWKRQDTDSTLKLFAESTGGEAFLGGNNLVQSFRQATEDDSSYYVLGYYINRSSAKPGWHQVSVTINRKGAHARYRNGFFLARDTSVSSARKNVELALSSPLDFVGVPLSVSWSGKDPSDPSDKSRTRFDLVMQPNFASVDEADQNHLIIDIAVVARDANGEVAARLSQRIDTHLKPDGLQQIEHNGMTYRNGLRLPAGEYTVRFVVRDALGDRMGSVAAPIKVAP